MTKRKERYLVIQHRYLSDGVSAWMEEYLGTELQCKRYVYDCQMSGGDYEGPMTTIFYKEWYGTDYWEDLKLGRLQREDIIT